MSSNVFVPTFFWRFFFLIFLFLCSLFLDATGVEINTPKGDRDNAAPVIITITGTADGVARASRAINDLCTKG